MVERTCNGITATGKPCQRRAGDLGYCHVHDPALISKREEAKKREEEQSRPLNEVLDVLTKTCRARGWSWRIESIDETRYQHASFSVERRLPGGTTSVDVAGVAEVSISDNSVRLSMEKTSFHGYGISDLQKSLLNALYELPWLERPSKEAVRNSAVSTQEQIEKLLRRFHLVARQLRSRHEDRETLTVKDEYDVQDLLHAMLRGIVEDVRPEEYGPSYAGGCPRMDFLLKNERTVIECKVATAKLRDKAIGEQLIIDIQRYKSHPSCERLICFVYDPDGVIRNPEGLETDLTGKNDKTDVKLIIAPR